MNPAITVTVEQEVKDILERLATQQRKPVSSLVREAIHTYLIEQGVEVPSYITDQFIRRAKKIQRMTDTR